MSEERESKAIHHPVLAFRPGEQRIYSDLLIDQDGCYAVMLLETPSLPGGFHHGESLRYTVLCAGWYTTEETELHSWGWVHLDYDTKEIIGNDMMINGYTPGQWYYMVACGGLGTRSQAYYDEKIAAAQQED